MIVSNATTIATLALMENHALPAGMENISKMAVASTAQTGALLALQTLANAPHALMEGTFKMAVAWTARRSVLLALLLQENVRPAD